MKIFHHYHSHKFRSPIHSDFWNFELSLWLHLIGYSVVSIFIPVLMLSAGYSLVAVLAYCAIFYLLDVPLNFFARNLVTRFGARFVIITGTICAIVYFAFFPYITLSGQFFVLIILAILAALYDSLYWVAHYYLFMESMEKEREVGKSNGILKGVQSLAGMLGPAIGAGILFFTNQSALLVVSIIFLTLSIFPLFALLHIKDKPRENRISYKKFFKELPEKKNFISWFLYSIHWGANDIIWPVFIFILLGTLDSIVLVAVIISVSKIILSYVSGAASGRKRQKLFVLGIAAVLFIWIFRLLYPSVIFYYLSILLVGFFAVLIEVPLDSNLFERAKLKAQSLTASTFRNAVIMLPQGILFAVLALVVGVFKVSFLSAIVSLILLLLVSQFIFYFSKRRRT